MARSEAQKRADAKYEATHKAQRANRKDFWLFEFYPESAPQNWPEVINSWLIDALVSPLHDKDMWTEEDEAKNHNHKAGTLKKAHYHGIIFFDGSKSFEQVRELIAPLNGPIPERPIGTKRNCTRYLCHLNNPEKHQYDEAEVLEFQNADYETLKTRDTDKYGYIGEMMDFVDANAQFSYAYLLRFARAERPEWFRCLCDNGTYVMKEYCKTAAFDAREQRKDEFYAREQARREAEAKDSSFTEVGGGAINFPPHCDTDKEASDDDE